MSHYLTGRRLIHLLTTGVPLAYLYLIPDRVRFSILMAVLVSFCLIIDRLRVNPRWRLKAIFERLFGSQLRPHELDGALTGASWSGLGMLITVVVFPREIAIAALFVLTIGDPLAGLIGERMGGYKFNGKSIFAAGLGALASLGFMLLVPGLNHVVAAVGAVAGMTAEVLPLPVNDNLRIPFTSGLAMLMLRMAC